MAATIVFALLALWLVFAATGLAGALVFAHQQRKFGRMRFAMPEPPPRAAVIVPMKGVGAEGARCLAALYSQDYPAYRVIVAVEAAGDPAHRLARETPGRDDIPLTIVVAGPATTRGQKVHNLLAALAALEPGEKIVCFADADALWTPATLSRLVGEISAWDAPVLLGGNRWMYPSGAEPGAVLAAAAGLPVAAAAKSPRWDIAWGGTMAATRETLARLDLPRLWERSLSDDVPLARALRAGGLNVKLVPDLAVPSPCGFSPGAALNFARRQYAMLRLYAPRHWWFSLAVYAVFFAGLGASVAAFALPAPAPAQAMVGAAFALIILRGLVHAAIALRCLPKAIAARLRWPLALDALLPVLPALLHAYGLVASLRVRRLRWAGITYALTGNRVEHVER
jgi:cellulose synthase/poly-beta-1,6-N-acetylglucosamine synthase-like glycosyltransferase